MWLNSNSFVNCKLGCIVLSLLNWISSWRLDFSSWRLDNSGDFCIMRDSEWFITMLVKGSPPLLSAFERKNYLRTGIRYSANEIEGV